MQLVSENKMFGGMQKRFTHRSEVNQCEMTFSIYLPPQAETENVPVLYWLSGLTCTDENFVIKAGAQQFAAQHGVAVVAPDTSPRGEDVPDDPENAYDFGLGAGFYVDATQPPWDKHYHMYSYITEELPALIEAEFPVTTKRGIFGHSMGGHGALTIALRNPDRYQSVSAFAPIVNPMACPWGHKALGHYLGDNQQAWLQHDTCELLKANGACKNLPLLVTQGVADNFLEEQLLTDNLAKVCEQVGQPLQLTMAEGYDHSYFFIATFMEAHILHHSQFLV
ncbi:MAG: S-formylglutathione hydrolase [Pseudomonadales bacterium]|nr:S-formylglutathione hydrolase [Pseudomonadales bacterium]